MDKDERISRAELALFWAKGGDVQYKTPGVDRWRDYSHDPDCEPPFFTQRTIWRKKPEPLEGWVWRYDDGESGCIIEYGDKPARNYGHSDSPHGKWVRVREVD